MDGWLSGTTTNPYSQVSVWTQTPFTLEYMDQDLNVRLGAKSTEQLRAGDFIVPTDVHISLAWMSDLGAHINGWPSWDLPGTMTISSLSDTGLIGSFQFNFDQGGSLAGSFDLSFVP